MPPIHAKSPCCQETIYRYGSRRRQCASCRRTWRIRPKRRGRKRIRVSRSSAIRYLQGSIPPSSYRASYAGGSRWKTYHRMTRARDALVASVKWGTLPPKIPLIVIADAIWQWINGERYTLHLIILKPLLSSKAVICPPLLRIGDETLGWPDAFTGIPKRWQRRIFALVCDGNVGMTSYARSQGWLLQRCHAHLRRFLSNYLSRGPQSRHRLLGDTVHTLVTTMLTCPDRLTVARTAFRLREIYYATRSRGIRKVISGFLKHATEYRTYLAYPEIDLPTTTNAVESLNNMIRNFQRRTRGFRSTESFLHWVSALLMNKKTIMCNGYFSTKLTR